jgi:ubiquinone/menaquinone biosynthesis C-methylase UbiE
VERVPEEELMGALRNARAYADADFSEPNAKFLALFSDRFPAFDGRQIIDLGCGPADITIRLAERYPQARVVGVDGADAMLDIARERIGEHPSLAERVRVSKWYMGKEAYPLDQEQFHAVVSNSLLHHMDDPRDFWNAVRACAAPHAAVLVMDLIRPQSLREAETIVEKYSGEEPEILKGDFLNSLRAAYRPAEIEQQLARAAMTSLRVEVVSDRHCIAYGFLSETNR